MADIRERVPGEDSGDPRDPRPGVTGFWADHNCWARKDGTQPCRRGGYHRCEFPHARND